MAIAKMGLREIAPRSRHRSSAIRTSSRDPARRSAVIGKALVCAFFAFVLAACGGGGGGGGDVEPEPPPPGGSGTGAGGVPVFWAVQDWNVNSGGANAVRQTADGGFVAAGFQATGWTDGNPPDFYVLKTDGSGAKQWSRRIAWPGGGIVFDVREVDGGYLLAGTAAPYTANATIVLHKVDAGGATVAGWPKSYGPAGAEMAYALHALNQGAGGYLVVGVAEAGPLYVLRLDAAGSVLWQKTDYAEFCGGGGRGEGRAVTPTQDGHFVIAGRTGCSAWAGFLLKIDGTDGHELWRRLFDDASGSAYTDLVAVAEAGDGHLVAAGSQGSDCGPGVNGSCDAFVIKTDSAGQEVWRRLYGGAAKDRGLGVALAADGSLLVAGLSHSFGGAIQDPALDFLWTDVMLVKITADGTTLWHKIKGQRPRAADQANAIVALADGGFAIAGSSGGTVMTARFDPTGATVDLGPSYELAVNVPATMGTITFNTAVDIAGLGANALILPREVGAPLLDRLIAAAGGSVPADYCTGGGSYTFTPAVPGTLAAGASHGLAFDGCVTGPPGGEQLRITGSVMLTVDAASGAPASGSYTLQVTASSLSLVVESVGTTTVQNFGGGLRFARSASGGSLNELVSTPAGVALAAGESSGGTTVRSASYGPMSVHHAVPASGNRSVGEPGDSVTATSAATTFTVSALQTIVLANASAQPAGGVFRVSAADGSRVTATISAGATDSTAALAVDADGDGVDDGSLSVPWDFVY